MVNVGINYKNTIRSITNVNKSLFPGDAEKISEEGSIIAR
jgi:hypothetical protein